MYTPEINFLKERPQGPDTVGPGMGAGIPDQTGGVLLGGAGAIVLGSVIAAVALGAWGYFAWQVANNINTRQAELQQVDTQLATTTTELQRLQARQAELQAIEKRTEAFRNFFNAIQPWSAILQDLRNRVPANVWITSIAQQAPQETPTTPQGSQAIVDPNAGPRVQIEGGALSFDQINDFQLTLLQSPFVFRAQLTNSEVVRPAATENRIESVRYTMQVTLKRLELISDEALSALQAQGATGLATKIRILKEAN